MKKGQAAMEFLMTYGWAIIVILLVGVSFAYWGTWKPSIPKSCQFAPGISCIDQPSISSSNSRVDIAIYNARGFKINITGITDSQEDSCNTPSLSACLGIGCSPQPITDGFVVDDGQKAILRVNCEPFPAGKFSSTILLNFRNMMTGLDYSTRGEVKGMAE